VVSGIIIATALFAWIVCSWNGVARVNLFPSFWPVIRVQTFLLVFGVLLVSYLAEETIFRGMIQTRLSGLQPAATIILSTLIYAVIASVALVAALYTLFPSASYAATFRSLSVPLMPVVFLVALIAFSIHGVVAAVLFHFTGSIMAPALFLALLVSFLFSGPLGVRTY
jgi:membrane protease YdiL (CAAX protease family)